MDKGLQELKSVRNWSNFPASTIASICLNAVVTAARHWKHMKYGFIMHGMDTSS